MRSGRIDLRSGPVADLDVGGAVTASPCAGADLMPLVLTGRCDEAALHRAIGPIDRRPEVVDLRSLTFVTPAALVGLAAYVEFATARSVTVEVLAPDSTDTANYLARARMAKVFDRFHVAHDLPVVHEHDAPSLWALQPFETVTEVTGFAEHLEAAVRPDSAEAASQLFGCLTEAGENVEQHAGVSRGYLAAQRYRNGSVHFAVSDAGRGFLSSLSHFDVSDDKTALELALSGGYSDISGRGRGYGLHDMAEQLQNLGGRLTLVSGVARVSALASGRRVAQLAEHGLQGSMITGTFPLRRTSAVSVPA